MLQDLLVVRATERHALRAPLRHPDAVAEALADEVVARSLHRELLRAGRAGHAREQRAPCRGLAEDLDLRGRADVEPAQTHVVGEQRRGEFAVPLPTRAPEGAVLRDLVAR